MVKKVLSVILCVMMLTASSVVLAGGPPGARSCGPAGANAACAYWGDAPFPGMCGGVVALPFLVVGSLLGGNTMGPCAPPGNVRYNAPPRYSYAPAPRRTYYGSSPGGTGLMAGLGCFEMATDVLGAVTGGTGLLH
jgi:hypothetical protein